MTKNEVLYSTWDTFQAHVRRVQPSGDDMPVWRGQRERSWLVQSAWERFAWGRLEEMDGLDEPARHAHELHRCRQKIYSGFRQMMVGAGGPLQRDLDEETTWAVGRHYGLITPLLDWSESPYIAVFFS